MNLTLANALEDNPIIAAVKDENGLAACLANEELRVVFVLYGDLCSIGEIVGRIKTAGKIAIVHADLIVGLASKEISVDYLKKNTQADGIISTRQAFIKRAKELGLYGILRIFVFDSLGLSTLRKGFGIVPDYIDILPGTMPKTLRKICTMTSVPILTGGLIEDKEDVFAALDAGAVAISTTNQTIWML